MTLDDFELYKFEFSENFSEFRRFRTQLPRASASIGLEVYCLVLGLGLGGYCLGLGLGLEPCCLGLGLGLGI